MLRGEFPSHYGKCDLPTEFRGDENPEELRAQGEALALLYLDQGCPEIEPAAVEMPVEGSIGGVHVRGFLDILDVHGTIIDLKTAAKSPSEISPDYKFQVATYRQLAGAMVNGEARVDTLVKNKTPKLVQLATTVEPCDLEATARLYPLAQRSIRAGHFLPNRSSRTCSRKYCAAWRECQEQWGGRVAE